jgi:hypothetical protein
MAEKKNPLSEFKRRLESFCTEDAAIDDELVTPCRSVVMLSASPKDASHLRPRMMQTGDLDELKRWIGLPDEAVKGRTLVDNDQRRELRHVCTCHEELTARVGAETTPQFAAAVKALDSPSQKLDAIRAHARSYLYGDSTLVADAKAAVEAYFGTFMIPVWLFKKITVKSGSVLAFGPGSNVLLAAELEIEQGGQVVSYGTLTVNVATLRKTKATILRAPLNVQSLAQAYFGRS